MKLPLTKTFSISYVDQIDTQNSDLLILTVDEKDIENSTIHNDKLLHLDVTLGGIIHQLISFENFKGKWLETTSSLILNSKIAKRICLLGVGKKSDYLPARIREIGIQIAKISHTFKTNQVLFYSFSQILNSYHNYLSFIEIGFNLGIYKYPNSNMKDDVKKDLKTPIKLSLVGKNLSTKETEYINQSINFCRLLQDGPPNIVTPKYISSHVEDHASKLDITVSIFGEKKLRELGFNAMLAVSAGSANEPQFVVVEYKPKSYKKTLTFVGKGLTMDTGGYSIKTPSTFQEGMKYDMSGAAVTLSSILAIAQLKLPIHVYAIGALCENMIDAHSYRVGDIITSYSGKTIEILNTDAEGRVVLSDALHYAAKDLKSDYIVEYSTLTGAMITALGHTGAGLFCHNKELEKIVIHACEMTGDKSHPLPIWEEISDDIKGTISDVCNVSATRGAAGSISAAAFLNEFVENVPYMHIDIAGVSDNIKAIGYSKSKGSSGYGVQLSVEIAKIISEK